MTMIGIGVVTFFRVYPFEPLVFNEERFPVLNANKTVYPGDELEYEIDYCKFTHRPGRVNYQIVNSIIYLSSEERVGNVEPGCRKVISRFVIPEINSEGEYNLTQIVEYEYPFNRIISVTGATEKFMILKKPEEIMSK